MQKKLKIITFIASVFVIAVFVFKYFSTIDRSVISFHNYLQDIPSIIKDNIPLPENKYTANVNKSSNIYTSEMDDFNYNLPVKEVDTKAIKKPSKKLNLNIYEDRIRMEAPEELDSNGLYVALMQAVADNDLKRAKTLIARGSRLDTPDGDTSFAPIFWAIENGNVEMVKLLIQKGARVNTPDDNGLFPIHWVVQNASKRPHSYQMKAIFDTVLAAHPNEVNRQDTKNKQTPLMLAVILGNKKAFSYLLDKGANVNIIDSEKMNIVSLAVANACHSCVYLIEAKEKTNKITPLPNFTGTVAEPDPIWLPYSTAKKTITVKKKKKTTNTGTSDIIIIQSSNTNMGLPTYKEMPEILPLNTEKGPDIVLRAR